MENIQVDGSETSVVSAADLVRNFAHWRLAAMSGPIYITNHGRRTHVLASAADFDNARRQQANERNAAALHGDDLIALADWIEEAVIVCDRELHVLFANRIAYAITRHPPNSLEGKPIAESLPELRDTLMEVHLRRTAVGSEPSGADIPSPFTPGAWLRMQCFPIGPRNVLIFRDITEDVQRHRMADVKEAIIAAMSVHGGIGYVRLSMRGAVERVDQPFCDMLGLPERRVLGVHIFDLVVVADRPDFRGMLESVLSGQGPCRFNTSFLTNRGEIVRGNVSIVQLHGAYAAEGAVLLITEESPVAE